MQKKLTLTIEESLIQFAHQYAEASQQSVSKLVENFIRSLKVSRGDPISNKTQELYGIFSKKPVPEKRALRKYFHDQSRR